MQADKFNKKNKGFGNTLKDSSKIRTEKNNSTLSHVKEINIPSIEKESLKESSSSDVDLEFEDSILCSSLKGDDTDDDNLNSNVPKTYDQHSSESSMDATHDASTPTNNEQQLLPHSHQPRLSGEKRREKASCLKVQDMLKFTSTAEFSFSTSDINEVKSERISEGLHVVNKRSRKNSSCYQPLSQYRRRRKKRSFFTNISRKKTNTDSLVPDSQGTTDSQMSGTSGPPDESLKPVTLAVKDVSESQTVSKDCSQVPSKTRRKPQRLSTSAQIRKTRQGSVDLKTPNSILVNINLKTLVNKHTFAMLPMNCQDELSKMLPECDFSFSDESLKLNGTALSNEFFTKACMEWRDRLQDGEFTYESQNKRKHEDGKDSSKLDPWKAKHFESSWGEKLSENSDLSSKDESNRGNNIYKRNTNLSNALSSITSWQSTVTNPISSNLRSSSRLKSSHLSDSLKKRCDQSSFLGQENINSDPINSLDVAGHVMSQTSPTINGKNLGISLASEMSIPNNIYSLCDGVVSMSGPCILSESLDSFPKQLIISKSSDLSQEQFLSSPTSSVNVEISTSSSCISYCLTSFSTNSENNSFSKDLYQHAKPSVGVKRCSTDSEPQLEEVKRAKTSPEPTKLSHISLHVQNVTATCTQSDHTISTHESSRCSIPASASINLVLDPVLQKQNFSLPTVVSPQSNKKKHQQLPFLGSPKPQTQTRTLAQIKAQNQAKRSAKSLIPRDTSQTASNISTPFVNTSDSHAPISCEPSEITVVKSLSDAITVDIGLHSLPTVSKCSPKLNFAKPSDHISSSSSSLKHKLKIVRVASPGGQVTYKVETCFDSSASNDEDKLLQNSKKPLMLRKNNTYKLLDKSNQANNMNLPVKSPSNDLSPIKLPQICASVGNLQASIPASLKQEMNVKEKCSTPQIHSRLQHHLIPDFQRQSRLSLSEVLSRNTHENPNDCSCNLKAMVICSKCGAFCHNECIGPSRICITCLIAT